MGQQSAPQGGRDSWDTLRVPLAARSPADMVQLAMACLEEFEEARAGPGPPDLRALAVAAQAYVMLALAMADPRINPQAGPGARHAGGPSDSAVG